MDLTEARNVAQRLIDLMRPLCSRIEVAGSVRRGKVDGIKNIELLAVPEYGPDPFCLVQEIAEDVSLLDSYLDAACKPGRESSDIQPLARNPEHKCWDKKQKALLFDGHAIDLFLVTPPATWGVLFALRTGPAEFSRSLVTSQKFGGLLPDAYTIRDGRLLGACDMPIATPEEEDLFHAIGLNFIEPRDR